MYENDRMILRKNEIRPSWQAAILKAVAQAPRMQTATDDHFRFGVATSDVAHVEPSLLHGYRPGMIYS
jgi:hypothetical protein